MIPLSSTLRSYFIMCEGWRYHVTRLRHLILQSPDPPVSELNNQNPKPPYPEISYIGANDIVIQYGQVVRHQQKEDVRVKEEDI